MRLKKDASLLKKNSKFQSLRPHFTFPKEDEVTHVCQPALLSGMRQSTLPTDRVASRRPPGTVRTTRNDTSSGCDEHEDPFLRSIDPTSPSRLSLVEVDEEPKLSILDDFDGDNSDFVWDMTRTTKPREQFVDMPFNFAAIKTVYRYLTGKQNAMLANDAGTKSPMLCEPGKSWLLDTAVDSSESRLPRNDPRPLNSWGPFRLLFMVYDYIVKLRIIMCFGGIKQCVAKSPRNEFSSPDCLAEEDGLSATCLPMPKSRNLSRVEERIRREVEMQKPRELPEEPNSEICTNGTIEDLISPSVKKEPTSVKIDSTTWMNAGEQLPRDGAELVGPEKRSGNIQEEMELTIEVRGLHIKQHPESTAEEKTFGRLSTLYEEYKKHVDTKSFQRSTTRLIGICKRIRVVYASRNEESKETVKTKLESFMTPLLDDLKSASADLVTESKYLRDATARLKQGWEELLAARERLGFSSCDFELETVTVAGEELSGNSQRLAREISPTKRVLNQISRNKSYPSIISLKFLDNVESTLSNMDHVVIALVPSKRPSQPERVPKEEKLRRHRISSEKYFARLLINCAIVGDTKVEKLDWPTFSVKLNHRFICKMFNKPIDTCIQIWKSSIGFMPNTLICACYVSTPKDEPIIPDQTSDDSSQSQAPTMETRLQFSSNGSPNSHHHMKGIVQIASSCKVRIVKRQDLVVCAAAKIPREDHIPIFHLTKRLVRFSSDFENYSAKKTRIMNEYCPDRQAMMAFKLPVNGILFSNRTLLEEPLRHILIKKRQKSVEAGQVPSPIPITEQEVRTVSVYPDSESTDKVSRFFKH